MPNLADLVQKAKLYALDVGVKHLGPAAFASLVSTAFALLAAHQGLLESWGITWGTWPLSWPAGQDPSGQVILIELDTLGKMGLAAVLTAVGSLSTLAAHHGNQAINTALGTGAENPPGK